MWGKVLKGLQKVQKADRIIGALTGQKSAFLSKVNKTPSWLRVQKVPTWLRVKKRPDWLTPKSSLGRDLKQFFKVRNWRLLKKYLKTLTWKNLMEKFKFGKNQLSLIFNQDKVDHQRVEMSVGVRRVERDLLRRMFTNKRYVRDFSILSSSWCHSATWFNTVGSSSAGMSGILNLTVKQETKQGVKIGKTILTTEYRWWHERWWSLL